MEFNNKLSLGPGSTAGAGGFTDITSGPVVGGGTGGRYVKTSKVNHLGATEIAFETKTVHSSGDPTITLEGHCWVVLFI